MQALLLFLVCSTAFAIPEANYERVYQGEVVPYWQSLESGEFKNAQGLTIRYRAQTHTNALRTLVILPGRTEPAEKYAELMYDLQNSKLNIFVMDHQGQGESDRLLTTDAGHVRKFNDYVADVRQFMRDVVIPQTTGTERLLFAHSLGGTIGVHYLQQVPTGFARAVLSAPMLQINTKPYSETVAGLLVSALWLAGKGRDYAPGYGPYKVEEDTFEANQSTHSAVRFEAAKRLWTENPQMIVGGPTTSWVKTSIAGSQKTLKLAPQIQTPILIMQAGQEQIVVNARQNTFCQKAPHCRIALFAGSKHAIQTEKDEIREQALARLKSFLGI